ncbi:medium-chain specific acyl-CoA dehydrogenase [Pyricularia oryzae 70-15]|uniref:Medium-chain specific acyl-CoA dehydrogenase n=1 Tax=Pyricularia oryzae (strain 70-15 / ATCC MYA-4617 / FGSC 8958) TaxID=242507 RepID=G4NK63_PYRO7|nr:medium-chain specific acyl-CoA dehydrogenase [Pyricularia oryzae 70-15]EHA46548.1 medium-chain specific acyl-CoA dehydrogenase [Pyricularia oryzae 70-15]
MATWPRKPTLQRVAPEVPKARARVRRQAPAPARAGVGGGRRGAPGGPREVRGLGAGVSGRAARVPAARPADSGGDPDQQLDAFHELILMDEMARLPSGVAIALAGASNKRRWLPGLFSWQTSFCLAITEPTAGSDVGAIRTSAVLSADGSEYVVNGLKKWVTGAPWATHMTTAVRTSSSSSSSSGNKTSRPPSRSDISLLVIPLDSRGVSIRKIHNTGHNAGGSSWVELREERFILTVDCNRQARECLAEALRHAHERETFGRPLASHQIIRAKLAALARDVEAHWAWLEQLAHHVKRRGWQARDLAGPVALAKIQGGRVVERAVRESQQVHGGMAYERGKTITEQISRDLRLKVIGGGSEEILTDLAWREEHKVAKEREAKL